MDNSTVEPSTVFMKAIYQIGENLIKYNINYLKNVSSQMS